MMLLFVLASGLDPDGGPCGFDRAPTTVASAVGGPVCFVDSPAVPAIDDPLTQTGGTSPSQDAQTPPTPGQTPPPSGTANDIVVTAHKRHDPGDPLQGANIVSYKAMQRADDILVAPATNVYEHVVPSPLRDGIANFLTNLREPIVAVNYFLQLKPGKAAETVGRFLLNTTVGIAGIFDVAKHRPFNLPRRRNGFANTLARYGVGPGPFLFLPFVGPSTVRDFLGDIVDRSLIPISLGGPFRKPAYTIPAAVFGTLERRANLQPIIDAAKASPNPYATRRAQYLEKRRLEIEEITGHHAKAPKTPVAPTKLVAPATSPTTPPPLSSTIPSGTDRLAPANPG